MGWLLRKLDMLIGGAIAGTAGAAASQLQAFILQYLQRLGGHVDEARRAYDTVLHGQRYQDMAAPARDLIARDALERVNELQAAHDAIQGAGLVAKPFVFARHVDMAIAQRTWEAFTPALPIDAGGLIYAGMGLIAGLVLYEIAKAPLALGRRREKTGAARR